MNVSISWWCLLMDSECTAHNWTSYELNITWQKQNELKSLLLACKLIAHSNNFANPYTGAHMQNIECIWRDVKYHIPQQGRRQKYFASYLAKSLYKKCYKKQSDGFHQFLIFTAQLYNFNKVSFL